MANYQSLRTHCPAGHPYDEVNTRVDARGSRHCRTCQLERNRRRYAQGFKTTDRRTPEEHRARHLMRAYGITLEEHERLYAEHDGKCRVCGVPGTMVSEGRGDQKCLVIDHCHELNVIRGLLCHRCNKVLGLVGDDEALLVEMISYLSRLPSS